MGEVDQSSVVAFQSLLTQLYIDGALRDRFIQNPVQVIEQYPLSSFHKKVLCEIDHVELERYAQGLLNKRLGIVEQLIAPVTKVKGLNLRVCFFEYARSKSLSEGNKYTNDALMFLSWLNESDHVLKLTDGDKCVFYDLSAQVRRKFQLSLKAWYVSFRKDLYNVEYPYDYLTGVPECLNQRVLHIKIAGRLFVSYL